MTNKRGQLFDIFVFMAIALVVVLFLGLWLYGFDLVTTQLEGIPDSVGGGPNISQIAEDTFGQVNTALANNLPIIAFTIIIGMFLTILLSNFLVKVHPAFLIVYILVTIIGVVVAVSISNLYETIRADVSFGPTLATFGGANFLIANLPLLVVLAGFLGAIFLTIGILRDRDTEGVV